MKKNCAWNSNPRKCNNNNKKKTVEISQHSICQSSSKEKKIQVNELKNTVKIRVFLEF